MLRCFAHPGRLGYLMDRQDIIKLLDFLKKSSPIIGNIPAKPSERQVRHAYPRSASHGPKSDALQRHGSLHHQSMRARDVSHAAKRFDYKNHSRLVRQSTLPLWPWARNLRVHLSLEPLSSDLQRHPGHPGRVHVLLSRQRRQGRAGARSTARSPMENIVSRC
jgi:hypothetical protein